MNIKTIAEILKIIVNSCSNSGLEFDTSNSVELTGGELVTGGVTLQGVCVKDVFSGESQWYQFAGAGIGIGGGLPVSMTASDSSFPSTGSRILEGPFSWNVYFDDLVGAGHIFTLSGSLIGGQGVSILSFGESLGEPALATAYLVSEGVTIGMAGGAGVMAYRGIWYKTDAEF